MADAARPTPQAVLVPARRTWSLPILRELPKLTGLTLASAIGGTGGTGSGGSTVFGILLAVGLLVSGCSGDQMMEPSTPAIAPALASISCTGDVATKVINCADPVSAPGQAIVGGQGKRVVLQSSDVHYVDAGSGVGDLTFQVQVRNISAQVLGYGSTGIRVFFEAAPVGVPGTITVEDDSTGTFTAGGQHYYKYPGQLEKLEITAPLQWRFHMTGGVNTFTFNVLVAATVGDLGGVLRWESVAGYDKRLYTDVAAHSSSDRMVVGEEGATAHFDGTTWTTLPAVVSERINAVTTGAPGEYFAATRSGRVLHYDGKSWTIVYDYGDPATTFLDIWASGDSIVVAVGVDGRISRLSPTTGLWSNEVIPLPWGSPLVAVSGNADGSLIATINGASGQGEFFVSASGGPFLHDETFGPLTGTTVRDVLYDPDGNAIITYGQGGFGVVLMSGYGALDFGMYDPSTLASLGAGQIAVGYSDGSQNYIKRIDYSGTPASYGVSDAVGYFNKMAVVDAGTLQFQVVSILTQDLYEWNGLTWAATQGDVVLTDPDLWGTGDLLWFLDGAGKFYSVVDGVPTKKGNLPGMHELWGISATSFFGATNFDIYTRVGTGGWSYFSSSLTTAPISDLWASPSGSTVMATTTGTELFTDYFGVTQVIDLGDVGTAIWGCNDVDSWIATAGGKVFRWQSGSVDLTPWVNSPTPLRAITGAACDDIWVAGDGGAAYHWDGISWTDKSDPGAPYASAITMRGPDRALVAGDGGTAGVFSATGGFLQGNIPTQEYDITSLWRLDNGEVYAAGQNLLLRGFR